MITQIKLTALDFKTMEDYFEYILLSEINGQRTQVKNLIDKMSKQQKKNCLAWFQDEEREQTNDVAICKQIVIEAI